MKHLIYIISYTTLLFSQEFPEIISSQLDEIKEHIANFPFSQYSIVEVPAHGYVGYFYIDTIEDCIKGELAQGKPWESDLSLILTQYARPGTVALDIGSHIGTHTLTLANAVGKEGKVFAFEPQPKTFRELVQNMRLNEVKNVICTWAAIGSATGQIEVPNLTLWNE